MVVKVSNIDAGKLTLELFAAAARKQLTDLGLAEQTVLTLPTRPDAPMLERLDNRQRRVAEWNSPFAESAKLEAAIKANLEGLGYGE